MVCLHQLPLGTEVILRHSFGYYRNKVRDAENLGLSRWFLVDLVAMAFVDSDRTSLRLVIELSFLDEAINEVLYDAILGDENIVYILRGC
jgi:hypothetical protein